MQRLDFKPDEKISRKEYLKRKKKQASSYIRKSKITIAIIILVILLSIYIIYQFYIYNTVNNYKYLAGEGVNDQKVYGMYYLTAGYTYEPNYSLNYTTSDGFVYNTVAKDINLTNIMVTDNYIYGIKDNGLYRYKKDSSSDLETIIHENVKKYTIYNSEVYAILDSNNKILKINLDNLETKELNIENANEILVDDQYIYVASKNDNKNNIARYDKNGENKLDITKDTNASYMVMSSNKIFFVNKSDSNKIYYVNKDGSELLKLADVTSVSDDGTVDNINGSMYMYANDTTLFFVNSSDSNNLWKINIEDKTTEQVIAMSVELLQNVDNTIFYKSKTEPGIYLFNYDTKFMSQITKDKVSYFCVDGEVENTKENKNVIFKN